MYPWKRLHKPRAGLSVFVLKSALVGVGLSVCRALDKEQGMGVSWSP